MGWTSAFLGRVMKIGSPSTSNSNPHPPVFAVNSTELLLTADVPPELTVRELNKATRSFSAARIITGQGHKDTVYYRATLPGGTAAAAKRLGRPPSSSGTWSASDDAFLRQQVSALSLLRHDNLVRLLGYTIAADHRVLLFELATAGTLHDALHGGTGPAAALKPTLSWAQRARIALDAARGLQFLHEAAGVSHWGIRSSNVLLFQFQQGLRAKIADYDVFEQRPPEVKKDGSGRRAEYTSATACWYQPPEYRMIGSRIAGKNDVYSFGVVLLELLTGRTPRDLTLESPHMLVNWATPILTKGRVKQCIDPKLGTQYPPTGALKLGRIALECLHDVPTSRPSMGTVARLISGVVESSMPMPWWE